MKWLGEKQAGNIAAARAVAELVKTMLGPKGMDKMMVNSLGEAVITNDGLKVMEELSVEHPATRLVARIAKTMSEEAGDGTKTAMVLAGELLKKGAELIRLGIHPCIVQGYQQALEESLKIIEEISTPVNLEDEAVLEKIAETAMTGKILNERKQQYARILVDAVRDVMNKGDAVTRENFKFFRKPGEGMQDVQIIRGIVMDKRKIHPHMPERIKSAKIAILSGGIEVRKTDYRAEIEIAHKGQRDKFLEGEEKMLRSMVSRLSELGVNAVLCNKAISELAAHHLARAGIFAAERVKMTELKTLARAAGAKIVFAVKDLTREDIGYAGALEEMESGEEKVIVVKECANFEVITLLLRGASEQSLAEAERALKNAVAALAAVAKEGRAVPGGGALEAELASRLQKYSRALDGREQLAVAAFAVALEVIPKTIAQNAGLDYLDLLLALRATHANGNDVHGIDVEHGKICSMFEEGVAEPANLKAQAISCAAEVACMILRVDDNLGAAELEKRKITGLADE